MSAEIMKYDVAREALAACVKVDEVKAIRDKAEAMAQYARRANDSEMARWLSEIRVRAERKAGELLAETGERGEREMGRDGRPKNVLTKLKDIGITYNQSAQWQKIAAIPEAKFEKILVASEEPVTTRAVLRAVAPPRAPESMAVIAASMVRHTLAQVVITEGVKAAIALLDSEGVGTIPDSDITFSRADLAKVAQQLQGMSFR